MKLRLEPVEYKHLKWLREQRNRRSLMDFCRQPFFLNECNQEDWFKEISRSRSMLPFIVVDKELASGSDWVGYAAFSGIDWIARRAEISYFTAIEMAGKSYAESAIPLVLEYGFRRLGFQKIHTDTFAFNDAEIALMESIGFKRCGELERHYFKRGLLQDSVMLQIFSEDFSCPEEVLAEETRNKPL